MPRPCTTASLLLLAALPARVWAADILSTDGFSSCATDPTIDVTALSIEFDKSTDAVTFDVAGDSSSEQNVTATLTVTAYGEEVYSKSFDPCSSDTYVTELCPVPSGNFSASGSLTIPSEYIDLIPALAFDVPDLDGVATLELKNENGTDLACIEATVTNGKTTSMAAVSYVAASIAGAALALSAISAVAAGGAPGAATASPNFGEVVLWFQTIATSGMLSVNYPSVYSDFTQNFGFAGGLIAWAPMQNAIDNFRASTGGNLTDDSYTYLEDVTIVDSTSANSTSKLLRRMASDVLLYARDSISASVNGTTVGDSTDTTSTSSASKLDVYVEGIEAYVEELSIPSSNTFMTVLLIFACVLAVITTTMLLGKVILEAVALASKLPKSLESFRKRYWMRLAKAIIHLVLLLYGVWTLYSIYQFTDGDSWAAKVLAAVTWSLFTAMLAFLTWRVWSKARQFKRIDGDVSGLYENKDVWVKYNLMYSSFKKGYWWIFIPAIIYMFVRNAIIAALNGNGLAQAVGQIVVESIMLILLVWTRPYQLKSGNFINIFIQVVRVITVVCLLIFTEELGISETTSTILGVVLIVIQASLTGLLAIMLAVNAIMNCVKTNPHRRQRKDAEKARRDLDDLTPLDARNSLLMADKHPTGDAGYKAPLVSTGLGVRLGQYESVPVRDDSPPGYGRSQSYSRPFGFERHGSRDGLIQGAAGMAGRDGSGGEPKPTLPDVGQPF